MGATWATEIDRPDGAVSCSGSRAKAAGVSPRTVHPHPAPHPHRPHLGVVLEPDLAEWAVPEDEGTDDVHEEAAEPEEDAGADARNDTVGNLRGMGGGPEWRELKR